MGRDFDPLSNREQGLLGVEEVARYLGVGPVTVYRWCRRGRLPCMKVGRNWRIRREALEEFLKKSEQSFTLEGRLNSFLEVPDNVLSVVHDLEMMRRLDAAFFRVGEEREGTLIKYHGENHPRAVDELRAELEGHGLEVGRLEEEGRLHFIEEPETPGEREEELKRMVSEEGRVGRSVWVDFNWEERVDLDTALKQQRGLTERVQDGRLVVNTSVLESILDGWPGRALAQAQVFHSGSVWLTESGLSLSRSVPPTF